MKIVFTFIRQQEGATAVEYGIMVAAIAAVIITIVLSIGEKTNSAFSLVNDRFPPLFN